MMASADNTRNLNPNLPFDRCGAFLETIQNTIASITDSFGTHPTVAVACSGGADSMALLLALHQLSRRDGTVLSGGRVVALTVNHHLRDTAGQDCDFVKTVANTLGIECHILNWHHNDWRHRDKKSPVHRVPSVNTRIQERARHARYDLLSDWCLQNGVLHLCTGHHRDDQIETVLMRQNAGSGAYGLAGIAPIAYYHWGQLLRPLLGVCKKDCQDFLTASGMNWVHDPSNDNPAFERIRLRQSMTPTVALEMQTLAQQSAQFRQGLDKRMASLLPQCHILQSGCVAVPVSMMQDLWDDNCHELWVRMISAVGGHHYRIGTKDLSPLLGVLSPYFENPSPSFKEDFKGVSVGGCDIVLWQDKFWIVRSWGMVQPLMMQPQRQQWDNKFDCSFSIVDNNRENYQLGVLGRKGWQGLAPQLDPALRQQIRARLPLCAIYGLPTLRQKGEIMAVQGLYNADFLQINWHMTRKITPSPFSFGI